MEHKISRIANIVEPSSIRNMFNLASTMSDVVNLGIGEPDFDTPINIVEVAQKALLQGHSHYTVNAGMVELREAISKKFEHDNSIAVDPISEIITTTGAMAGLYLSLQAIINSGDEVILPLPSWPNYINHVIMAGGRPVFLPTEASDGFSIDPERLATLITPRTKAILINTPMNPTGAVCTREILQAIADLAIKYNIYVISDEVYEYFIWDGAQHISIASLPGMAERTITVNSLSKSYAMTGWRIGYVAAPAPIIAAIIKLQENIYACVNSIAQVAAIEALTGTRKYLNEMIEEYRKRRAYMMSALSTIEGLRPIKPFGAFYMVVQLEKKGVNSWDFAMKLLTDAKVCVVPGVAFGSSPSEYIRITYATSMIQLEKSIARIQKFMEHQ